jgi:hypothetical protein
MFAVCGMERESSGGFVSREFAGNIGLTRWPGWSGSRGVIPDTGSVNRNFEFLHGEVYRLKIWKFGLLERLEGS